MKKIFLTSSLLLAVLIFAIGNEPTKDLSLAKVNKKSGKYIFLNCEPVHEYEVVYNIEIKFVISSSQMDTTDEIADMVLKRAFKMQKKEGKEFDAIIVGTQKVDLAIKFK